MTTTYITGHRNKVAGAGSVVADRIAGDVHVYNQKTYQGPEPTDEKEAYRIYCSVLANIAKNLPLQGLDMQSSDATADAEALRIADVYIEMDTTARTVDEEDSGDKWAPLRVLDAVVANRRVVLLGDPGAGKSMFVNHLMLRLADHIASGESGAVNGLPSWPDTEANCLPVPVVLRDFNARLGSDVQKAEPRHLWDFICDWLTKKNMDFMRNPIERALETGTAIVLLDGLDEVPGSDRRSLVRDAVQEFSKRYGNCRFVVTCRVLSYQPPGNDSDGDLRLNPGLFGDGYELAPFDDDRIDAFIDLWYGTLLRLGRVNNERASAHPGRMKEAVHAKPDVRRIAANPLLLTVMALVHTHKGELPEARALLYEQAVDVLLYLWDQGKSDTGAKGRMSEVLAKAGCNESDLKEVLSEVAYDAHIAAPEDREEEVADVSKFDLLQALRVLHPTDSLDWAEELVSAIQQRAGLLIERRPDIYAFPHRTFQEYLVGCHLSRGSGFGMRASERATEGDFWRIVIILSVGRLMHLAGDRDKIHALLAELCPQRAPADEADWRRAWLAGECILEAGVSRLSRGAQGSELYERVRDRLRILIEEAHLSVTERSDAGSVLGRLGDPRFSSKQARESNWITIPACKVVMGAQKTDSNAKNYDSDAQDRESPVHRVQLGEYTIGKYPVTVCEYREFVEDGGYRNKELWKWGGWEEFGEPEDWEKQKNYPNRPVTGVSWYEAVAYAKWAGCRLPTEAEWERAARGPGVNKWPWGEKVPNPTLLNFDVSNIGSPTPVGIYPDGASSDGCMDMAGNAWEWCSSLYEPYPYNADDGREDMEGSDSEGRVLRGGSCNFSGRGARCAYRGSSSYLRRACSGFRVVASPFSSSLNSDLGARSAPTLM